MKPLNIIINGRFKILNILGQEGQAVFKIQDLTDMKM